MKLAVIGFALILSACNAHALRQILVHAPEPELAANQMRMQFDCTENGLVIFEGFPDIVRAHPVMIDHTDAPGISTVKDNASHSRFAPCQANLTL